ncbi:hypothetical protein RVR_6707 [Actinacidiphila reveromycinica]|uniref:ARB-07466-like C-terminal domain-containing protein n=1 Tax=Actinacidiphila reveromycinica TaxID=659352 RepID=A0A7U3UWG5_9ACTN|nr:heavy metal transporter [Streptomyces sp. SN-593]BBA99886.1 hypothetical protein RVR_6707 [Streptomyces sp. SN-593]
MPDAPSPANEKKRRGCGLRLTAGLVVLLAVGGYIAYRVEIGNNPAAAGCTVKTDGNDLDLDQDQAGNAATIAAVAMSRGLPERAVTIALATALQESQLHNLDHGDRDSLGLFQQRPSQGWGTVQQIQDPVYASNAFYDSLVKIQGYTKLPVTVAAQEVQRSGYPEAYAQHEQDATSLAAALTGQESGALSCTTGADTAYSAGGRLGDPAKVTARLEREFGGQVKPHDDSLPRTVAVPSVPSGTAAAGQGEQRGWQVAQWAVAHAHDLKVEQVAFGDVRWQAAKSGKGWQKVADKGGTKAAGASAPAADTVVRITVTS